MLNWGDAFPTIETTGAVMLGAADLASDHQFEIWDGIILGFEPSVASALRTSANDGAANRQKRS